jgi:hypothetical protein
VEFESSDVLPAHSNGASFDGNTVERASVALPRAPNNIDFLADILLELIHAGIMQLDNEFDWNINLFQVRSVGIEVNTTYERLVTIT